MSLAIGLMSGTSLDGIDVALVDINGVNETTTVQLKAFKTVPMKEAVRNRIIEQLIPEKSRVDVLCSLNFEITYEFARAVKLLCQENNVDLATIDFVVSHGQTLYHQPLATDTLVASTLQLGEPAILSELLQTTVVSNLRPRDMVVGGQGAPIVPYSEYLLYRQTNRAVFLQNIGGISNVTVLLKNTTLENMIAFDTGPGNMIIDEMCAHFYNETYDDNGKHAANGSIYEPLLVELKAHPYLNMPYPKTTGREEFGKQFTQAIIERYTHVHADDLIATATYFTAYCIAHHIQQFDGHIGGQLIVGGGGSYNETLMAFLKQLLPQTIVNIQEDIGLSSEAKEAIAMVVIGNQTLHRQPSNVPSATGASKRVILGSVTYYD